MQADSCHRYKTKIEDLKMYDLIAKRLDNWDIAKPIYKHIAELNLLADFPNIDIQKMLFSMSHADLMKTAEILTGEATDSLTVANQAVGYFLVLIFNKIRTEPGFLDLLKLIMVIPMPNPIPEKSDLTEPDLSAN
jgi:hypothetical protein